MTYMKMTRGPESSTSLRTLESEPPTPKRSSIKNILFDLGILFSSMLLSLLIAMNLLPSKSVPGSIDLNSMITVGELMIAFMLTIIIYGSVRLLKSKIVNHQTIPDKIVNKIETPAMSTITTQVNRLDKLTRSAEQLSEVESLLIQKLGVSHRTDRVTDSLICKLQICTNRMMAQIGDLSDETYSKDMNDQEKTTVL